eukprot:GHVP01064119.1.p1 GENE.GHVP01064119.1~~GHVP01064119.1.p1  ORF type:complete len:230 (-),score=36.18 GHVP01064119.1:429-1118(-)
MKIETTTTSDLNLYTFNGVEYEKIEKIVKNKILQDNQKAKEREYAKKPDRKPRIDVPALVSNEDDSDETTKETTEEILAMLTKLVEKEVSGPAFPVSDKGLVKVEAAINGVVVDVLCDPGSYHNLCSPEVAKDLNLIFDGVTKAFSELGRDVGERTKTVDLIIEGFNPTNVNFYVCHGLQLPVVVGMEALGAIGSQINCVTRKLEQAALLAISTQIGPNSRSSVQKRFR